MRNSKEIKTLIFVLIGLVAINSVSAVLTRSGTTIQQDTAGIGVASVTPEVVAGGSQVFFNFQNYTSFAGGINLTITFPSAQGYINSISRYRGLLPKNFTSWNTSKSGNVTTQVNATNTTVQEEQLDTLNYVTKTNENQTSYTVSFQVASQIRYVPQTRTGGKVKYNVTLMSAQNALINITIDPIVQGVEYGGVTPPTFTWAFDQNVSSPQGFNWSVSAGTVRYNNTDYVEGNASINLSGAVLSTSTFPIRQNNWSMTGWIKAEYDSLGTGRQPVLWERRTAGQIFYTNPNKPNSMVVATTSTNFPSANINITNQTWTFYAIVINASWNSSSGIGRDLFYINGTLISNVTSTGNRGTGSTVYLNAYYDSNTNSRVYGLVDGVRWWSNYTLTQNEVTILYNSPLNSSNVSTCTPNTTPTLNQNFNIICGYVFNCTTTYDIGTGKLQVENGYFRAQNGCHFLASGKSINKANGGFSIIKDGTATFALKK